MALLLDYLCLKTPSYLYNDTQNYVSTYILETHLRLPILYFTLTL